LQKLVVFWCDDKGKAKTVQHCQKLVGANTSCAVFKPRQQIHRDTVERRSIVNAQSLQFAVRSYLSANIGQVAYELHCWQCWGVLLAHISEFQKVESQRAV